MIRYIIRRLLWMIPIVLCVTILIFTLMYFVPGDPASMLLGANATQAEIEAKRHELGLDAPYLVRLWNYLTQVFLHFDFGTSTTNGSSITTALMERFPRTLVFAVWSIILAVVIGVPLGVYAAVHQNTAGDRAAMLVSLVGISIPRFWLALLLVAVFSVTLHWLPSAGLDGPQYYVLPVIANALPGIAIEARHTRGSMLEVIRADYVTTGRAKGASNARVTYLHALPNALIPVITILGSMFAANLAGTIIIENVFGIPGIGNYLVTAINTRDYNAVQGTVIFVAITLSLVMLLTDILLAFADPRIKAQFSVRRRRAQTTVKRSVTA